MLLRIISSEFQIIISEFGHNVYKFNEIGLHPSPVEI